MPSGLSDAKVNAVLDSLLGASAGSVLPANMYLDLLTTAPSDDNGTGAVSWGQGRVSIATVNGSNWPSSSGRAKAGATVATAANTSGSDIDVVAFAFYTASTAGTYLGGGPLPGALLTVPNGASANITVTLSSPPPS